ncbi:MAG: hypothetical protein ACP5QN_01435 [Minisyncoccia bacterium]
MEKDGNNANPQKTLQNKNKRPWIITLFCFTGIIWLFLIFLGIIGLITIAQNNFNTYNLSRLIIEIIVFISGAIALRLYWLMRKKAVYILGVVSGFEIIFSLMSGVWPLSFSCGCDFPIILTILGLIYIKEMN